MDTFIFQVKSQMRTIVRVFLLFAIIISLFSFAPVDPVQAQVEEICGNGIDDDGDGMIDGIDPDCCDPLGTGEAFNPTRDAVALGDNTFRLTDAVRVQSGAAWYKSRINLLEPFDFEYDVYLGDDNAGADGIAFVMHNDPDGFDTFGAVGGGLGYQGITPSIAVEMDTYYNGDAYGDITDDHIAITHGGEPANVISAEGTVCLSPTCANVEDNANHHIRINWDPVAQTLVVFFDGVQRVTYAGDIINDYFNGGSFVYFGFTASTGGLVNRQQFKVTDLDVELTEICGNGLDDDCDGIIDHADQDCPSAPFVCGAEAFLFQEMPTEVWTVDLATGGSVLHDTLDDQATNAIGYNLIDNYIWGVSRNVANTEFYVTAVGADLVPINYTVPGIDYMPNVGDVSADGRLFTLPSGAPGVITVINVDPTSPDFLSVEEITSSGYLTRLGPDWAFNPIDGNIYMIAYDAKLVRIDPDTGVFTDLGLIDGFDVSDMWFGAQFFDGNGTLYGSDNQTGTIVRITEPHNGNRTAEWFADGPESTGNDGARCTGSTIDQDYGDAPDSYTTLLSSDGPRHTVNLLNNPIYLGISITTETDANAPLDGTGDGGDDGIAVFDRFITAGASYSVDVTANNTTGREGTLYGWIDFNLNGTFEAGEGASVSVPDGTNNGTVTLTFPGIDVSNAGNTTYGRFRLTTDTTVTSFTGAATDGEVEDYLIEDIIVNQIGTAKTISSGPVNNGDGTYTLDYSILVENAGDQVINNIQVVDDLSATFAGATAFSVDSVTSGTFTVNGGYDGSTDTNLLDGTDSLAVEASGTITLTVTVTPGSNLGVYNNTAIASGESPEGAAVTDDSQDGTDVDPDSDGNTANNDEPTPVSFTENPEIGVAKTISSGPVNNGDGTYTLDYSILVENTGDIVLDSVQVTDDLSTTFAGVTAFSVDSVTSSTFTVNGSYDGSTDTNLLDGTDSLAVGTSETITLTVTVTPGSNLGPYNNMATASGESPAGTTVTDDSQDGTDVDPDGDGTPTNNDEPTPVTFTENPEIGVAKTISSGPVNNEDGTYTLDYAILVENTGDIVLDSVQVMDDLSATFAGATAVSVDSVTSGTLAVNGGYDGSTDTNLLDGTDSLAVSASGTITLTVTVTPGSNLGPYNNTATASGESPAGTTVTDDSQDGTDVDPDGDGTPTNNDESTPVTFIENPEIGVAKTISSGPVNNGGGTHSLTYSILVENTGDVSLGSVQVAEDLSATFAGVTVISVDSVTSGTFAVNGGYDGSTDTNLLDGTDSLAVGASGTITLTVTVTPGSNLGPYNNTATASGESPAGTTVTDDSQDGTDVDPDGDGTPTNNDEPTPVTFRNFSISGTVWDDSNEVDGEIDTGEPGIAGVTVVLVTDPDGTPSCQSVQTDANGYYEFADLWPGDYRVIEAAGENVPTPNVCIPGGEDPTGYNVSSTPNVVNRTIVDDDIVQDFGDVKVEGGTCGSIYIGHIRSNNVFDAIDVDTGEITYVDTFPETLNATGHNVLNDLVYGIVKDTNEAAVISPDLDYIPLGTIAGLPDQKYVAGDVDANGHMYILAEGPVQTTVYVVDFDSDSMTYLQMIHDYPLSSPLNNVGDIALNPADNNFYGFEFDSGSGEYELIQINPVGLVTRLGTLYDIEGNPVIGGDVFGAVYFTSLDNRIYGYRNNPGLYMVDVSDNDQPEFETVGLKLSDMPVAENNDGFRCNYEPQIPLFDFGDAPDSYETLDASGGPKHDLQQFAKIRMGTFVHQEKDGIPTTDATGDDPDIDSQVEEDGVSSLSTLKKTATEYSVDVNVTNRTGRTANLVGWIDFNRNGIFEAAEGTSITVGNGAQADMATLTWPNLTGLSDGQTYLRLRFTTDEGISTETPGGFASDGEVEDYAIFIQKDGSDYWPETGFAPGVVTMLPEQPVENAYSDLGSLWLEVPKLNVESSIVGVYYRGGEWKVSWLDSDIGYLQGSAFPTWVGNTVLVGHNYLRTGQPGPFADLDTLRYGDRVVIHAWGEEYIYEVRISQLVTADDIRLFGSSDYDILTLVTCEDFDEETEGYSHRIVVQAVLIDVKSE